ncbi:MAG: hypothetical protein VKK04_04045 [Synechococcales bacterium]|nr:hypothetical protein [Synechococcales bacterium]
MTLSSEPADASPFGPGFWATFLYYFTSMALLSTLLAAKGLGLGVSTGIPQQLGLVAGLMAGGLGGYFNRTTAIALPISNQKTFLKTLNEALEAMGYYPNPELDWEEGVRVYERSPLRKVFSGRVYVQLEAQRAIVASRAMHIRSLKRRLG